LIRGAVQWATGEAIGILPTTRLKKPVEVTKTSGTQQQPKADEEKPTMVTPDAAPGAFLRASVFPEHWLAYGCGEKMDVFYTGNIILKPLSPAVGRNVVTFTDKDKLLISGFCWPKTLQLLAESPYVAYQSKGKGHIIAFADDPNYRAMYPAVQRLFINAVMFSPGH
jgi:hypothetical protein